MSSPAWSPALRYAWRAWAVMSALLLIAGAVQRADWRITAAYVSASGVALLIWTWLERHRPASIKSADDDDDSVASYP